MPALHNLKTYWDNNIITAKACLIIPATRAEAGFFIIESDDPLFERILKRKAFLFKPGIPPDFSEPITRMPLTFSDAQILFIKGLVKDLPCKFFK